MIGETSDLTNFLRYLGHTKRYTLKGIFVGAVAGLLLYFIWPATYTASIIVAAKQPLLENASQPNTTYGELQGRSVGAEVASFIYTLESPDIIQQHLGKGASATDIRKIQKKLDSQVLYPDPFVKITYGASTTEKAKETFASLIKLANDAQKKKAQAETTSRIKYLHTRLQNTYDATQKITLAEILRAEEMKSMAAEADPYVTIHIIDRLYVDHKRDSPQFFIFMPLFIFAGFMSALFLYHLKLARQ